MLSKDVVVKEVLSDEYSNNKKCQLKFHPDIKGYKCAVEHCPKHSKKHVDTIFFRFPKNKGRADQWLQACHREDLLATASSSLYRNYRICSDHFTSDMMKRNSANKVILSRLANPVLLIGGNDSPGTSGIIGHGSIAAQVATSTCTRSVDFVEARQIELGNATTADSVCECSPLQELGPDLLEVLGTSSIIEHCNIAAQPTVLSCIRNGDFIDVREIEPANAEMINNITESNVLQDLGTILKEPQGLWRISDCSDPVSVSVMENDNSVPKTVPVIASNNSSITETVTLLGEKKTTANSPECLKDLLEVLRIQLCRICGKRKEVLSPIYCDDDEFEGEDLTLLKKIEMYLPVQIHFDRVLPKNICDACRHLVESWHELHMTTVAADSVLKEIFDIEECENDPEYHFEEKRSEEDVPNNSDCPDNNSCNEMQRTEEHAEEREPLVPLTFLLESIRTQMKEPSTEAVATVVEADVTGSTEATTGVEVVVPTERKEIERKTKLSCIETNHKYMKKCKRNHEEANNTATKEPSHENVTIGSNDNDGFEFYFDCTNNFLEGSSLPATESSTNYCEQSEVSNVSMTSSFPDNELLIMTNNFSSVPQMKNKTYKETNIENHQNQFCQPYSVLSTQSFVLEDQRDKDILTEDMAVDERSSETSAGVNFTNQQNADSNIVNLLDSMWSEKTCPQHILPKLNPESLLSKWLTMEAEEYSSEAAGSTSTANLPSLPKFPLKFSSEGNSPFVGISPSANLHLLTCGYCRELFPTRDEVIEHKKMCAKEPVVCEKCGKTLAHRQYFKNHIKLHTDPKVPKVYVCETCGKKLSSKSGLECHVVVKHSGQRQMKHYCEPCCKAFLNDQAYRVHSLAHERGLIEGLKFKISTQINENGLIHICPVCGENFNDKMALIIHMNTTGRARCPKCQEWESSERNIFFHECKIRKCRFCGRQFSLKSKLKDHEQTHVEEKPFRCSTCGEFFRTCRQRKSHNNKHNAFR